MQKGFHVLTLPHSPMQEGPADGYSWLCRGVIPDFRCQEWAQPLTQPLPTASTGPPVLGLPTKHLVDPPSAGLDGAMGPDDAMGLFDTMGLVDAMEPDDAMRPDDAMGLVDAMRLVDTMGLVDAMG